MRWIMVVGALGLGGCRECTLMYAPSTTSVAFNAEVWSAGTYEIEAQGYNRFAMCVFTLPRAEGDLTHCTGNAELDLNEAGDGVGGLTLWEFAPDSFQIEILRDGELVESATFSPTYDVAEPNGPGCGEQRIASVVVNLTD